MANEDKKAAPSKTADRRRALIETAEALFAEKGVDAVSLNEINKAAGQKNTSALHYHFGSKDKLIDAIIYQEFESIVSRLNAEFDALEQKKKFSGRDLIVAVTMPFIELVGSVRGRNYLRIMVQLLDRNPNMPYMSQPEAVEKVRARAFAFAEPFMTGVPDSVKLARLLMFATLLFRTLEIYAKYLATDGQLLNLDVLVSVMHDGLEQIIFAPVSESTRRLAADQA